jgi:hypothetical protein
MNNLSPEELCLTKDCLRCIHREEHPASRKQDSCGADAQRRNVGEHTTTAPLWCPMCQTEKPDMVDITGPKLVEVQVRLDQKVVWVNVDGKCALRCCKVWHVVLPDNAEWDGTDAAHPAWWRGHAMGVLGMTAKVEAILDGKDNGAGVTTSQAVEIVRRRLLKLVENKT